MQRTFATPQPISLFVELRSGDVVVHAEDTAETVVEVSGRGAEDVIVDQRGKEIVVIAKQPRHGFFDTSSQDLSIQVSVPLDSRLSAKLGSADVRTEGRLGETTLKSGSGDVQVEELGGASLIATGSGDVAVGFVAAALQVKSGSGDVSIERLGGPTQVSTGSGDVRVVSAQGSVRVKSGSGKLRVQEALGDVSMGSASGDLVVDLMHHGQLTARNASGDITVGVPAGVPVWTDITSISGAVRSNLEGAGEPKEGQEFLELRAKTVSGDVYLEQV
jgi:DUF4097 and DUF4098 domain-containing protein YvlB